MNGLKTILITSLTVILVFSFSSISLAGVDNSKVGTRAFNFLKIEISARPVSMGGAYTGISDDEASVFYNPSGFAGFENKRFAFGYLNNIFEMQTGYVSYFHPLNYRGDKVVAVYLNYLNYGDFTRTNNLGEELGTFSGSDILFSAGYAQKINEQFRVGGMLKLIYEKIEDYSSHGFAFDVGAKYILLDERTSFGFAAQNLGAQLSGFTEGAEKDPLPMRFRLGFSHYPVGLPLLLAGDIVLPTDNDMYFALGTEVVNIRPLYLRFGWNSFGSSNFETGSSNDWLSGFSAGFGVELSNFVISYAISPQADLGTSHRVTFNGGF